MALLFQPKPRSVIFCNFTGFIAPEIVKRRPVVILATHKRNSKLVTVVPLSTTAPDPIEAHHYRFRQNPLPDARDREVWAKCDMVAVVSIQRLDLLHTGRDANGKRQHLHLNIGSDHFDSIRHCVASALGLLSLTGSNPAVL